MTIETDLLRMLEPAVRPDGVNAPGQAQPTVPIEQQGFQQLLDEAKTMMQGTQLEQPQHQAQENQTPSTREAAQGHPLEQLASVDRIENDSLRVLMGQNAAQ